MDKVNDIEKTEKLKEQVKELFKDLATTEINEKWADTFDIEIEGDKQVVVYYHGTEKIKAFKKECKKLLVSVTDSVMGERTKVKILKKPNSSVLSPKVKKNIKAVKLFVLGMVFVCLATAVVVVMCSYIENRNFRETFYNTSSIKVDGPVRIIQLSDLHGTSYGKNNKKLLERVEALNPDIIICTGDMVDSDKKDIEQVVSLCEELGKIAPTYYIYGNNEVENIYGFPLNEKELDDKFGFDKNNRDETAIRTLEDSFEIMLENKGVNVLKNEKDTIRVGTINVDIYGVLTSNPSSFWSYSGTAFSDYIHENPNNLKITAVHEPFIFEEFNSEFWGDLMVCGHTHGGVVRVPMFGPLFTHEGGLFPERSGKFVYGRYNVAGSPLIVSGGLENLNILRVNNQPEIVVIDINKF